MSSKYQFVQNHASQYAVTTLCRVLGVSRSGYYTWRTRPESQRSHANRALVVHIQAIHTRSRRTYGSPRIHAELREQGVQCSAKRVARLMRLAGLQVRRPRRTHTTTDSRHALPVAENVLDRAFDAPAPNRKWAAEIVRSQMTKTHVFTARTRRNDVADLDIAVGHDDAVDEEFH